MRAIKARLRVRAGNLEVKVTLWTLLLISIGGVGQANLAATTYMEARPMKNSIKYLCRFKNRC